MYTMRRSGRLNKRFRGNEGNDEDEVIDLTSPEWDDEGEDLIYDEPNEHVDFASGVKVDKMEKPKAAAKARKDKLLALAKKRKNKQGEKGSGKCEAVKKKNKVLREKGVRKKVAGDNGSIKGLNGKDKSTDDECASVKRAKVHEVIKKVNKIHQRNPQQNLFRVITQLTRRQKQDIRDIGFGAFLDFKIKDVPLRLAYWLLDKFDADTCSLNVNGRSIVITPEVVRNMLGVPMGEVHINARNVTDFRNPLARRWKAQFENDLKRHYNTHIANQIVIPIKIWSSDMLNKLEENVFPKDGRCDTDVHEEAEHEVSDGEQVLEEDDVDEDCYSMGVPRDLEGMKRYVSDFLKKAGELVERADEVSEEGLENYPTDSGFIELKELRKQLFAVPTYSQQPRNNQDEKDEDNATNFTFHTPGDDGHQYPFTQVYGSPTGLAELQDKVTEEWYRQAEAIPTRLNFDEVDDIDLNITQPPATQGKVIARKLPEVLRSPYVVGEVSLICGISPHERRAANCLFSARLTETDIVFKMSHVEGQRSVIESLYPGVEIASGAIDLFTHVLNEAEKRRNVTTVKRLFCHTAMVTSDMRNWEYEKACEKFNENMEEVLKNSLYYTLEEVDLGAMFLDYMSYVNHPKHEKMSKVAFNLMTVGCNTEKNLVDCGIFVRHMETFKGDVDCCGFSREGEEQIKELTRLRRKYVAKILLADCSEVKKEFEREAHEFKTLTLEERMRMENDAFKRITARVKNMMK